MVDNSRNPIFVGGTGRSGSTIVGHLLDHHPDVTLTRPMEVRFITGNLGFADALTQSSTPDGLRAAESAVGRVLDRWFYRAENVGLHTSMSKEFVREQAETYLSDFPSDPIRATQTFVYAVMSKVAQGCGANRWVDTTPANARKSNLIAPIYPNYKVIVVIRDGRDVSASFVHQDFGPNDIVTAMEQWEQRMIKSHNATLACAPGVVLTIELQDLVQLDRQGTIKQILEHCDLDESSEMMQWFDQTVTVEGSHSGRWRRDFSESAGAALDELYAQSCARLRALGVRIPISSE